MSAARSCVLALGLGILGWLGCSPDVTEVKLDGEVSPSTRQVTQETPRQPEPASTPARASKMKFKDEGGAATLVIKWYEDGGAKLLDGAEKELARYTWSSGKLKIKDAADQVLGYVTGEAPVFKLEDPGQERLLFRLQQQEDGDWKLEDPEGKLLLRIKQRSYGVEVETPDDQRFASVKRKEDKISLKKASGAILHETHEPISADALACLALEPVGPMALRGALLVRLETLSRKQP